MNLLEPGSVLWRKVILPYGPWLTWAIATIVVLRTVSVVATCSLDTTLSCGEHVRLAAFGWLRFQWIFKYKEIIGAALAAVAAIAVLRPALGQMRAANVQAAVAASDRLEGILKDILDAKEKIDRSVGTAQIVASVIARMREGERWPAASIETFRSEAHEMRMVMNHVRLNTQRFQSDTGEITSDLADRLADLFRLLPQLLSRDAQVELFTAARQQRDVAENYATLITELDTVAAALPESAKTTRAYLDRLEQRIRNRIGEQHDLLLR